MTRHTLLLIPLLFLTACGEVSYGGAGNWDTCFTASTKMMLQADKDIPAETSDMPLNRRHNAICDAVLQEVAQYQLICAQSAREICPLLPEMSRNTTTK